MYAFCPPKGMTYALLRTSALCHAIPLPPTWWTAGAMHYKGLCIIRVCVKRGSTVHSALRSGPVPVLGSSGLGPWTGPVQIWKDRGPDRIRPVLRGPGQS